MMFETKMRNDDLKWRFISLFESMYQAFFNRDTIFNVLCIFRYISRY